MTEKEKNPKVVGSIIKAVDVLGAIASSTNGLGVTEISSILGQGVSATYHMLNTLKQCNMIEQNNRTKKYHIGIEIFRLSKLGLEQTLLHGVAGDYLDQLRESIDETCTLAILYGTDVMCARQSSTTRMIRAFSREGAKTPFYCTSGGKVIMSHKSQEHIASCLDKLTFEKFTPNTLDTKEAIKEELKKVKLQGYGVDAEERELGVMCISAPVFDGNGNVVASMGTSAPTYRMESKNLDNIISAIIKSALDLSKRLGYEG